MIYNIIPLTVYQLISQIWSIFVIYLQQGPLEKCLLKLCDFELATFLDKEGASGRLRFSVPGETAKSCKAMPSC